MRDDVHKDERSERARASAPDEHAGGEADRERLSAGAEAVSQGRDVHDLTRHGTPHGRDVVSDEEETPEIESHGRTVIDRSRRAEAHGVDVIDLGPQTPSPEEESDS